MKPVAFFAYPAGHPIVGEAILASAENLTDSKILLRPWEKMKPVGLKIDDLIRDELRDAKVLLADITFPNFNVFYEMGYAAAIGRPVLPTVNSAVERAVKRVNDLGLFDTIGWLQYNNSEELTKGVLDWQDRSWVNKYKKPKDHAQPLFLLDLMIKTDFRNHIFTAVENSHVSYRAFDPTQVARMTAAQAIADISASAGAIIPLLSQEIVDWERHNLRAAFLIGLCHGFEIECLAIQFDHGPAPLDFRDYITNSTFRGETVKHVEEYCAKTLIWNQNVARRSSRDELGLLGKIDLGSIVAEYEIQQLGNYFVKTAEYARALRAEGAVVTGRKGSGKSAIYFQVMTSVERDRARCVVDLRPASHNLSEMRETLLGVVAVGVFQHTIAAFWQYVMLLEVLLKVREHVLPRAKNDFKLQERIRRIEEEFELDEAVVSGDFTSRLATAIRSVITALKSAKNDADVRNNITNLLFEKPIPRLRDAVVSFSDFINEIVILVDDLDKGWPPLQVETHDVATLRHLVEVLNRIQRDLGKRGMAIRHMIFLRSDIYEMLVSETADRGKYNVIKVDWSDPEQLRHLLMERVVSAIDTENRAQAWEFVNPKMPDGVMAVDHMIDTSLRRPRFLIDQMERTLSFAINRGHGFITEDDVVEGARQMSLHLVSDFAYEMRDIAGTPEDILYAFMGSSSRISRSEIDVILDKLKLAVGNDKVVELLLWYGFLGVTDADDGSTFIYDLAYDFRRLEAERGREVADTRYAINPAFIAGLQRQ